jgi:hypothetical protein
MLLRRRMIEGTTSDEGIDNDYSKQYLTFEALEDTSFSLNIPNVSSPIVNNVYYSLDNGITWQEGTETPIIKSGEKVLWKSNAEKWAASENVGSTFTSTGNYNVSGNILSLVYGDDFSSEQTIGNYCFCRLFDGAKIVHAKDLILAATKIGIYAYGYMFNSCSQMIDAPVIQATELADACCSFMFRYCSSLQKTPILPAVDTATYCYRDMFNGCVNLVEISEIAAQKVYNSSFAYMFSSCSKLETTPVLYATQLDASSYYRMFYNCSKLREVRTMALNVSKTNCLYQWLYGVSSNGVFYKDAKMTSFPVGANGIPSGWTVLNLN